MSAAWQLTWRAALLAPTRRWCCPPCGATSCSCWPTWSTRRTRGSGKVGAHCPLSSAWALHVLKLCLPPLPAELSGPAPAHRGAERRPFIRLHMLQTCCRSESRVPRPVVFLGLPCPWESGAAFSAHHPLKELSGSGVAAVPPRAESAFLLGKLVHGAPRLVMPYVAPILKALVAKLRSAATAPLPLPLPLPLAPALPGAKGAAKCAPPEC